MNPVMEKFTQYIGLENRPEDPRFSRWLGGIFREVGEGQLVMEFRVRDDMTNPVGYLHGGAQNAIVDDVIGMTVLTLGHRQFFISLGLNVDYLGRAKVGESFSAVGKVIRGGKNVVHAQCELLNSQGGLICRGTSNLMRSPFPAMPELHRRGS